MNMPKINRRKFFSRFGLGTVAVGAIGLSKKNLFGSTSGSSNENGESRIIKYNELGKTGLKVSDISFGGSDVFSENVVRYAFDLGVNLFDTAESYQKGKSEEIIGKGLKGVRDKAYIITKHSFHRRYPPKKLSDITERVEGSLRRLQTDYIDILFPYHGINNPTQIKNDLVMEATEKLKKEGKIRFTGFSTHNAAATLAECIKPEYSSFIQVVLFIYNHIDGVKIERLVKKLHQSGIGTIAMKSQAGGKQGNLKSFVNKKQTYESAAIKWIMGNPAIHSIVISMKTFSHVEAYIRASGQSLKREDLMVLNEYQKKVDNIYCRMECNTCEAFCPKNVAISDIMRYAMYFEDYQQEKVAIQEYANLKTRNKPLTCQTCIGYCNKACPYHLQVKEKLIKIHAILS
jgi:predicted aldo/keto reductase-like oxidoreductase